MIEAVVWTRHKRRGGGRGGGGSAVGGGGGIRARRRAGRVGRVVDVFAVNVDGVAVECRAPVAAPRVPLLEPEELDARLDALYDRGAHGGAVVYVLYK